MRVLFFLILAYFNLSASCVKVPCTQAVESWYSSASSQLKKQSKKAKDELKSLKDEVADFRKNLQLSNNLDNKKIFLLIKRDALLMKIEQQTQQIVKMKEKR